MKTLLNQKPNKQPQIPSPKKIQETDIAQSIPYLKTQNRVTSAYYTTKIVKGLPLAVPQYNRTIIKTAQQNYPFFQQAAQPVLDENETQQSKQTQVEQELPFEIRASTAPENVPRKQRIVKDFKELMMKVSFNNLVHEPVIIQNKYPEFIQNVEEFQINTHVHKHIQRLKSSKLPNYQLLPRNQSSKLERQRDLIEKTIISRPNQSQQVRKRQMLNSQSAVKRPKTSNQIIFRKQSAQPNINPLENQWVQLTQKAQQQQKNYRSVYEEIEPEKELTHLDLQTNELTHQEKEYIRKKRNFFLDDIRPYIQGLQVKAEQKRQLEKQNVIIGKSDQYNSILSELENDEQFIQDDNNNDDSFEQLEDDIKIQSKPIGQTSNFFSKADPLNRSFKEQLQETKVKIQLMERDQARQEADEQKNMIDKPASFLKVGEQFSNDELNIILRELKKPVEERNYELLDGFCKNLKFFWQFSKQTRILLLKLSNLEYYKSSQYIFYEGQVGEQMYIILNGACHVRIKNPHLPEPSPIVSTLYTGQQFGELALIDPNTKLQRPEQNTNILSNQKYTLKSIRLEMSKEENNKEKAKNWWKKEQQSEEKLDIVKVQLKRSASIECAIDTYLLAISRDYFKSIILNVITSELEDKLKTLMAMPCFEFLSQMELIPIANLLESQTYRLGEVILKEGEEQRYFYIVASGRCKCVKEEVFIRDLKSLGCHDQKKPIKTGLKDYSQIRTDTKLRVKHQTIDLSEIESNNIQQSFPYQEIYRNNEYMAFKYHFHYLDFVRGDFFMGRVLLDEYKAFDEEIQEIKYDLTELSRLTVISDAAKTEVYKLDRTLLHLITQPLKQHLIDGIKRKAEYDHIFDYEESQRVKKWDLYKMNLFRGIMDQKSIKQ